LRIGAAAPKFSVAAPGGSLKSSNARSSLLFSSFPFAVGVLLREELSPQRFQRISAGAGAERS
jgi:hypothetical protein